MVCRECGKDFIPKSRGRKNSGFCCHYCSDKYRKKMQPFKYNEVVVHQDEVGSRRLATPENLVMVVAKLTAILRLANSMDRGHRAKLAGSRIAVKDKKLVITTDCPEDVMLEDLSIQQKSDFFEEIFGIRPVLFLSSLIRFYQPFSLAARSPLFRGAVRLSKIRALSWIVACTDAGNPAGSI